ncbi:MAG: RICIN domain-containing protein [Oscillospiraceae bacterium]
MKKSKRFLSILIVLTLVLSLTGALTLNASAATTPAQQETIARALKTINLFQGYSDTDFGLRDVPTREQALIFQIRALGEETAAKAWKGPSPFSDVPAGHWALPYIGYGVEMGYTAGIGGGKFGLGQAASAQMMTTFVLRGLGYRDSGTSPDFSYAGSLAFGKAKGMVDSEYAPVTFTRGDVAEILYRSLTVNVRGTNIQLADGLLALGVFTQAQFNAAMAILKGETLPEEPGTGPENGTYIIHSKANTNQVFDITNGSNADGASLILYKKSGEANQSFIIEKVGNYYTIVAKHSGKAISAPVKAGKGSELVQSRYTGADNQLFDIKTDSKGKTTIIAKNGLYVGASGGSTKNGTNLILWTKATDASQGFILKKVQAPPVATEKNIKFINKTGLTLSTFYCTSTVEGNWGDNLLTKNLTNGASIEITFPISKTEILFDLQVGNSEVNFTFPSLDVSKVADNSTLVIEVINGTPTITQK